MTPLELARMRAETRRLTDACMRKVQELQEAVERDRARRSEPVATCGHGSDGVVITLGLGSDYSARVYRREPDGASRLGNVIYPKAFSHVV